MLLCSHPLKPTLTHSYLFPLFFSPMPLIFSPPRPVSVMFSPLLLNLSLLQRMCSLSHPFSVHIHSYPIQSIACLSNIYLVPVFNVLTCFTYLCDYVPSYFTWQYAYVIHFYVLSAFLSVNTSGRFIYTAFFKNMLVILVFFPQCLFFSHGFSAHSFQCFHLFDILRAQTYLGPRNRIFSKFHWLVFKRQSWTFTISTFYLEMFYLTIFHPLSLTLYQKGR